MSSFGAHFLSQKNGKENIKSGQKRINTNKKGKKTKWRERKADKA